MDAHIVAIEERDAGFLGLRAKKTVALAVFAQRIGRAGQVAQNLRTVTRQRLRHVKMVVFGPAILAQHDAKLNLGATNGDIHGLQRLLYAGAFFGAQLL